MISVIVPVYNAQSTVSRCLDSILSQEYTDYEVLVVDDGSTDDSPAICDEYAAKDSRVRVFHKANGGVSSARNIGLDNSEGEWITFMDSDDMYAADAFSRIQERITRAEGCEGLVVMNVRIVPPDGGCFVVYNHKISTLEDLYETSWKGSVCNNVFRRAVIKDFDIRFDESIPLCEDQLFSAEYISHIDSLEFISEACYIEYLPASYKEKYYTYQNYPYFLSLYEKLRKVNRRYSADYVDGLVMRLLERISVEDGIDVRKEVVAFKAIVGEDIVYAKGRKKCFLRCLGKTKSDLLWRMVIVLYAKMRKFI